MIYNLNDFLSRCMHYAVWIHCCERPNYDICILQGNVAKYQGEMGKTDSSYR